MMKAIRTILTTLTAAGAMALAAGAANAAEGGGAELLHPDEPFPFEGIFGHYDQASLQRGLQVYLNVCSACHGLKYVAYRNLSDPGGPGLSEAEVKALAAQYQVPAGPDSEGNILDENGQLRTRPAEPQDKFRDPFPNEETARLANGGAYPPDLSLMAKARAHGPEYIYSLLLGYEEVAGLEAPLGQYYNKFYPGDTSPYWAGEGDPPPGGFFAMAQPLYEGSVAYEDGTEASLEQMSYDVANFLMWAAEPKLTQRKRAGLQVMLFLIVLTGLLYLSYRRVWSDAKKKNKK